MAILVQCLCRKRQSLKNKRCSQCGSDLVQLKKAGRLHYWVVYRLPNGKQKFELVTGENANSIEYARDVEAKRKVQKRENRIFDIKPEMKMTFNDLKEWYLGLEKTKALRNYMTMKYMLEKFCREFGSRVINTIKLSELENLQVKRERGGNAPATIDYELNAVKIMINKAFNNDLLGGDTLKVFKGIKPLLKENANARTRVLSPQEFYQILEKMHHAGKGPFLMGFWTGMREGEILNLVWPKIDLERALIKLEAGDTKDKDPRVIPILPELLELLKRTPRALHDPHVFLWKGKKIKAYCFRKWIRQACHEAGIQYGRNVKGGFVPHDLRHGYVTFMRKAGVDKSVIMELTGHSTESMFHRYNLVDSDDRRKAVERLDDFLRNEIANVDPTVNHGS